MSTKAEVLKMLEGIRDDEPLFLLRGQDMLAGATVRKWVQQAIDLEVSDFKVKEAVECCHAMERWPNQKKPD